MNTLDFLGKPPTLLGNLPTRRETLHPPENPFKILENPSASQGNPPTLLGNAPPFGKHFHLLENSSTLFKITPNLLGYWYPRPSWETLYPY
jgi:hypothetical protein